jgi:LemA protein
MIEWIIGGVVVIVLFVVILIYNKLVVLKMRAANQWAQIDVQIKKRYDLVPKLVKVVKEYGKYEKSVFENVTKARSAIMQATAPAEQAKAYGGLTSALKSLFAVAENYPNLKANENFLALQKELSNIETKIAYARQFYNDTVMLYNTRLQMFPWMIFASIFGFKAREFFKIGEGESSVTIDM